MREREEREVCVSVCKRCSARERGECERRRAIYIETEREESVGWGERFLSLSVSQRTKSR